MNTSLSNIPKKLLGERESFRKRVNQSLSKRASQTLSGQSLTYLSQTRINKINYSQVFKKNRHVAQQDQNVSAHLLQKWNDTRQLIHPLNIEAFKMRRASPGTIPPQRSIRSQRRNTESCCNKSHSS